MSNETQRISIRLLKSDKDALRRFAISQGEPISVVVRLILRNELKRLEMLSAEMARKSSEIDKENHNDKQ